MKSTVLLATTLFLVSAPAPDSNDIAEMTSNFIVPENVPGLIAADEPGNRNTVAKTRDKSVPGMSTSSENSVQAEKKPSDNTVGESGKS